MTIAMMWTLSGGTKAIKNGGLIDRTKQLVYVGRGSNK